ncbi:hypothetical protein P3T76_001244 [Phytophthora citrophthora]|uniref:Reverse transcriptase n=1 Tax=Phytophthora citrophthora TaxID=4793 RepID=A0AAD9GY53_9STRA|nr:hypothetical protein P3T76_001244 [Phytophthora citrophthora]
MDHAPPLEEVSNMLRRFEREETDSDRVTVAKVPMDLRLKFLDFDSVERCLVLDLDSRYDLILGMAWLERHEPWIDWRSKTLGATHFSPSGALASHEPTSARKQKRYWREHRAESAMMLEVGVSELVDSTECEDRSPVERVALVDSESTCGQGPRNPCGAARTPPSDAGHGPSLDADGIGPYQAVNCGAARTPSSDTGLGPSRSLSVSDTGPVTVIGCAAARTPLSGIGRRPSRSLSVPDTGPGKAKTCAAARTPPSRRSSARRRRRKALRARRYASKTPVTLSTDAREGCGQLYTLVDGVDGSAEGGVPLDRLPSVDRLLELEEMSFADFGDALKAGELAEVVIVRPEEELNSSSVVDESVLTEVKKALNARSGSEILKNPSDPFYSLLKEYGDVVSKEPPSALPPDRGFPELNTA